MTHSKELAALTLANAMQQAEAWFARGGDTAAARAAVAEILPVWQSLRRTLNKNGFLE